MNRHNFLRRATGVLRAAMLCAVGLLRTAVSVGIAAVVVVALGSCSFSAGPTSAAAANPPVARTWSVTADLVGSLAVAENTVVSYVRGPGSGLQIVAWDVATGLELWRDDAIPGETTRAVELSAQVSTRSGRALVPYLRHRSVETGAGENSAWMEVVVADLRSGVVVGRDWGSVWATSRPAECADGAGVCFTGWTKAHDGQPQRSFRIDAVNGVFGADAQTPSPPAGRFLGAGVFATAARAPEGEEMLGFSADGSIVWQRPYREVFGENSSSDQGWSWGYTVAGGPLIGWGSQGLPEEAAEDTRDFTRQRTVALARATGAVIWSLDGVSHCPDVFVPSAVVDDVLPLCRWNSGVAHWPADDTAAYFENFALELVGVDRDTGEIVWTLPVGGDGATFLTDDVSFHSSVAVRPLVVQGATVLVDAIAGTTVPASAAATFACERFREAFESPDADDAAVLPDRFNAGVDVFACDIDRVAVTEFSADSIRMAGVEAGRARYVVGGAEGLAMYQPGN